MTKDNFREKLKSCLVSALCTPGQLLCDVGVNIKMSDYRMQLLLEHWQALLLDYTGAVRFSFSLAAAVVVFYPVLLWSTSAVDQTAV